MHLPSRKNYFGNPFSRGFLALYSGKVIVIIASGLLGLFIPIFLYNVFNQNLHYVVIFYGVGSLLYVLGLPAITRLLNVIGFRRGLQISVILGALTFVYYYFLEESTIYFIIPLLILTLVFYRSLYWIPYHVSFAKFTDVKNRGRQLSMLRVTQLIVGVITPLIGGFVIQNFGFDILFITAVLLYLLSGIPYFFIPPTDESYQWGYWETWRNFLSHKNSKVFRAYAADGAESMISVVVWPIFIFGLLGGNYFLVGGISTVIVGITIVLQLSLGRSIDTKLKKGEVLKIGSVFYALGWVIKIFIVTAFHIFIIGAYHSITKIFTRTPFDTLTYEMSADEGHYIDEFTVLKEMALHTGKVVVTILIIILSFFLSIEWIFLIAALASLLLNLLSARDVHIRQAILE